MFTITIIVSTALSQVILPPNHPDINKAISLGTKLPPGHPTVHNLVKTFEGHQNLDELLQAGSKLPARHINVNSQFVYYQSGRASPATTGNTNDQAVTKTPEVASQTTAPVTKVSLSTNSKPVPKTTLNELVTTDYPATSNPIPTGYPTATDQEFESGKSMYSSEAAEYPKVTRSPTCAAGPYIESQALPGESYSSPGSESRETLAPEGGLYSSAIRNSCIAWITLLGMI